MDLKSIFKQNASAITQVSTISSTSNPHSRFIKKKRFSLNQSQKPKLLMGDSKNFADDGMNHSTSNLESHPKITKTNQNFGLNNPPNRKIQSRNKLLTKSPNDKNGNGNSESRNSKNAKPESYLILGGWDDSLFEGDLHFHPVVRKSWWTLNLQKVLLDGRDSNLCNSSINCQIIMDSGASLMATPPQLFTDFMDQVGGDQFCGNLSRYPRITFVIDEKEYDIDPFEYILSNHEDIDYEKWNHKDDCMVGFSVFDLGPDEFVWIAGDIFLSKYFSVYDREYDQVGLARAA